MNDMLEISGLSFGYNARPLFAGLGLTLQQGTISGLLGVNGAGKSTLLKLMTGLLFAKSGTVRALGRDPAAREPHFLADVFMLPEDIHVPNTSVQAYVRARAPFYPKFDAASFARYLREFELRDDARLPTLSYGQQKKFLLAFGLATQARLVLLDEPTNGLDIPSKSLFRRVIAEALTDERAFVISTHQVRDLGNLMDPLVLLHQGRVLLNRTLAEIGARIRMTHSVSPPAAGAAGLVFSEPAVGGFWSVWQDSSAGEGPLDLEVLFNALVTRPDLATSLFAPAGGAS
jgi:ABC-2 type transport system ATP-binding protein